MAASDSGALSVSQITTLIKRSLEGQFPDVTLEGEISNFRPSSTGHYYFTLKDDQASIQAVMFRNRIGKLDFDPADGQLVLVRGSVSVYARRGNYQIICEQMTRAGVGSILAMLEERKRKLALEGLFAQERKQPIPPYPTRVAVITSPTGAAIRDILQVTGRRHAGIHLVIVPTPVQGDTAAARIAEQIKRADRLGLGEVIILTRGGGSIEDLLPFSDEAVVRAVADCSTPVISAVGHEVDVSLCDLAADLRAPTPSAAAELVSANREELRQHILQLGRNIVRTFNDRLSRVRFLLSQFTPRNLERSLTNIVAPLEMQLDDAREHLVSAMNDRVKEARHRFTLAENRLQSLSPLSVLKRGFAIVTRTDNGSLLTDAAGVKPDEDIHVRFAASELDARVLEQEKHEKL